ncbi:hypothetical protein FPV67DRAFT_507350 [Lyophyllum atratum]|nr:hypothetical protein FPV67DRAFT_507350 [Lyophyllum atratum]
MRLPIFGGSAFAEAGHGDWCLSFTRSKGTFPSRPWQCLCAKAGFGYIRQKAEDRSTAGPLYGNHCNRRQVDAKSGVIHIFTPARREAYKEELTIHTHLLSMTCMFSSCSEETSDKHSFHGSVVQWLMHLSSSSSRSGIKFLSATPDIKRPCESFLSFLEMSLQSASATVSLQSPFIQDI